MYPKLNDETYLFLKGTWQWGGFSGVLQKLVPHRSLTLPFEPFQFRLQIRGDIRNWKTTRRVGKLAGNSTSRRVVDSPTRWVGESPWWVGESLFKFFKFIIDFPNFKRLNQPFNMLNPPLKDQFGKKEARDVMYYYGNTLNIQANKLVESSR
jgi:hypothetical protein